MKNNNHFFTVYSFTERFSRVFKDLLIAAKHSCCLLVVKKTNRQTKEEVVPNFHSQKNKLKLPFLEPIGAQGT